MFSSIWVYIFLVTPCVLSELFTRGAEGHRTEKKRKIFYNKPSLCALNFKDKRDNVVHDENLETIYFITPTYLRPEQIPELLRLSHTLMHVPKIHWIVADDSSNCSNHVLDVLRSSGLPYTYISSPKPDFNKGPSPVAKGAIPRGVSNRRAALNWLQKTARDGVFYFGDDDNTYDLNLFKEIRKTKRLSLFPVGLIGYYGASLPVVKDGKLVGFFGSWYANRKFPVDMAGFAVNMRYLKRYAIMPFKAGYLEDAFLRSLGFKLEDIEIMGNNYTRPLVWHTKSHRKKPAKLNVNLQRLVDGKYFDLHNFLQNLSEMGIVKINSQGETFQHHLQAKEVKLSTRAPQDIIYSQDCLYKPWKF